jgi:deoxyribodipyrimidine photolyase-related protein
MSPPLNNGLITPAVILRMVMRAYDKETSNKVRISILPTIEGYIRQLNWREYSRMLYICAYKEMRGNYFGNSRRLSKEWYEAKTGIEPVDAAITCAFKYGYLHHIVRLMVICNFMNLCGVRPYDAYCWFMEFSLDSYDWVMINNVYSMGMFADGGLTTTKAYISGGNYIKNMSDITVGDWAKKWTILYYYFIYRNYALLDGRSTIYKSQWDKYEDKEMIKREGKRLMLGLTSS